MISALVFSRETLGDLEHSFCRLVNSVVNFVSDFLCRLQPMQRSSSTGHAASANAAGSHYQPGTMHMAPGQTQGPGPRPDVAGNMSYPARPPSLHAQSGRALESPFDHGYFSVGSNTGSGSHDSFENCIPRLTPPSEEQSSNDKVLQYLGQQGSTAQARPGMSGQGMNTGMVGMPSRHGMPGPGPMGPRMGGGAMSQFNSQMPPQQQMPLRHPSEQMFNYRTPQPSPQQQMNNMQACNMRGMAPPYSGQGPGQIGYKYSQQATSQNSSFGHQVGGQQQSQGFTFEHPMSQRYSTPYGNHPSYGQTAMGGNHSRVQGDYYAKGYSGNYQGQGQGVMGSGPYNNYGSSQSNSYGSNQSSPDGYERSSRSRAKKQRLDSNAYQSKPQGLQYEPPTTFSQPLVDMKAANMFNPRLSHPAAPGCPPPSLPPQSQPVPPMNNAMPPGPRPIHSPYPQYNQQTPQSQYQPRHPGNYGAVPNNLPQHPGQQEGPMMNQGASMSSGVPQPHTGTSMNPMQMAPNSQSGLSVSQSYASLQAQLPPYQPGTQDFVQHLVTDK